MCITTTFTNKLGLWFNQHYPYSLLCWILTINLMAGFWCRIYIIGGFYIVAYFLAIYQLNLLLLFLTPKGDRGLHEINLCKQSKIRIRKWTNTFLCMRRDPEDIEKNSKRELSMFGLWYWMTLRWESNLIKIMVSNV